MKALIVDDEKRARNLLRVLIDENCPKITAIYEASNLLDGVAIIKDEEPNIIFLDIEMPQHSGLEILNFIDKDVSNFEIIFTTAYSEYAIQAFQLAAIDYLLKPIRPNQIKQAVDKAIAFMGKSQLSLKLEELKLSLASSSFDKIALSGADSVKFVSLQDIVLFQADGMYITVYLSDGSTILVTKSLKHFATILERKPIFFRPHRSYIINLSYLKEFVKKDGGYILMDNDITVSLSRDKKEEFMSLVNSL